MSSERAARRYAASSFPQIQEVRLVPPGAVASLVNLSTSGILVECESRLVPGSILTVEFTGTFTPSSMEGRVIRCEVIGIATGGSLRYRIGLAFSTPIALPTETADQSEAPAPAPAAPPPVTAVAAAGPPVLRNRW